jgi:hypothetical protein
VRPCIFLLIAALALTYAGRSAGQGVVPSVYLFSEAGWGGARVTVFGRDIYVGVPGNPDAHPPVEARLHRFVFRSADATIERTASLSLPPSWRLSLAAADGSVAVGLPDAQCGEATGEVEVVQRGSADWAKGQAIRRAGRVLLISFQSGGIAQSPIDDVECMQYTGFGSSVAWSGSYLAVGKRNGVIVFERREGRNAAVQPLGDLASFPTTAAVAWAGEDLIVGMGTQPCCGGEVRVYRKSGKTWSVAQMIANPMPRSSVSFGQVVDALPNTLLVTGDGISQGDGGAPQEGAADIFSRDGAGAWKWERRLSPDGRTAGYGNARTTALSEQRVYVASQGRVDRYDASSRWSGTSPDRDLAGTSMESLVAVASGDQIEAFLVAPREGQEAPRLKLIVRSATRAR